jgi:hypothetical protein
METVESLRSDLQLEKAKLGAAAAELVTVKKELAHTKGQLETQQAAYEGEAAKLEEQIETLRSGQTARINKAVRRAESAWTTAIVKRVSKLPISWSAGDIAKKIADPEYVHPRGIADFIPMIDKNGNVVRIDGELVPDD